MLEARAALLDGLRRELVGPHPVGEEIDCDSTLAFATWAEADGPYRQKGSGEEILTIDRPLRRYGIGVLYPIGSLTEAEPPAREADEQVLARLEPELTAEGERIEGPENHQRVANEAEDNDLPL